MGGWQQLGRVGQDAGASSLERVGAGRCLVVEQGPLDIGAAVVAPAHAEPAGLVGRDATGNRICVCPTGRRCARSALPLRAEVLTAGGFNPGSAVGERKIHFRPDARKPLRTENSGLGPRTSEVVPEQGRAVTWKVASRRLPAKTLGVNQSNSQEARRRTLRASTIRNCPRTGIRRSCPCPRE